MHPCVGPNGSAEVGIGILMAPEHPCIDDGGVTRHGTARHGSAEVGIGILIRRGRNWDSYPPRSELGFNLPRSAALDADATSAQEHF